MRIKNTWGIGDGAGVGLLFGPSGLVVSDTAAHNSQPIDMRKFDVCGFQLVTLSTLTGAWTLQQSLDYSDGSDRDRPANTGTWDDITALLNVAPAAVAAASNQYRQLGGCGLSTSCTSFAGGFIRVVFTGTANSGTVQALAIAKSLGS